MADIELFAEKILATLGVAPPITDILPGRMVRFATCDRKGDDAGWCKLFDDCEGGVFGCWRQGISGKWLPESNRTPEEQAKFLERVKQARAEAVVMEAEYRKECREKSADLWDKARDVDMKHPYLEAKGIQPFGIRQDRNFLLCNIFHRMGARSSRAAPPLPVATMLSVR
jgi:putative DNA primase/helicase